MASLTQRDGSLGKRLAAHLLRRCTYHMTKARIDAFALKTAEEAVDELFNFPPFDQPAGPVSYNNGVAWVTEVPNTLNHGGLSNSDRRIAGYSWWYNEIYRDTSIQSRLANFHKTIWVNGRASNATTAYSSHALFLQFAAGNLRVLAQKMTLDIDMLYYLNNRDNKKNNPNENFSREFLELFTILKGEQVSVDDYTNYTEADIVQAARVLTGFKANKNATYYNNLDADTGLPIGDVNFSNHDTGDKMFSSAFNNQVITGAVDSNDAYRELGDFISMVFSQLATARSYCRRLYRYFVGDIINKEIETDIIEPLAVQLHSEDYELTNTVKRLLKSQHFFDEDDGDHTDEIIGSKIKSPLMLNLQTLSYLEMSHFIPDPVSDTENFWRIFWRRVLQNMEEMGQPPYPDSVEGFAGYFKDPDFSKNWFDTTTIAPRYLLMSRLLIGKTVRDQNFISRSQPFRPDLPALVAANYSNQNVADILLLQILEDLLPEMPEGYDAPGDTSKRYNYFREALLGGLSVINWQFDWDNAQMGNSDAIESVKVALDRLFNTIISSPEYQTF